MHHEEVKGALLKRPKHFWCSFSTLLSCGSGMPAFPPQTKLRHHKKRNTHTERKVQRNIKNKSKKKNQSNSTKERNDKGILDVAVDLICLSLPLAAQWSSWDLCPELELFGNLCGPSALLTE